MAHKHPRLNTAAHNLQIISARSMLRLFVTSVKLRISKANDIDPAELEKTADQLRQLAWDIERKNKGN